MAFNPSPWRTLQYICRRILEDIPEEEEPEVHALCHMYIAEGEDEPIYFVEDINQTARYVLVLLYSVIMAGSCLGNGAVIILFLKVKALRSAHGIFIFALAFSDIILTGFCMSFHLINVINRTWLTGSAGETLCKMVPYVETFVVHISSWTIVGIAVERYFAIMHPLRAKSIQTQTHSIAFLAILSILASAYALPNIFWYQSIQMQNVQVVSSIDDYVEISPGSCSNLSVTAHNTEGATHHAICAVHDSLATTMIVYRWLSTGILLILPLLVMLYIYVRISCRLWIRHRKGPGAQKRRERTVRRVIIMLVIMLTTYFFCWAPTMIYEAIGLTLHLPATDSNLLVIRYFLQWLACSCALQNPILYASLMDKLKKCTSCGGDPGTDKEGGVQCFCCITNRVEPVRKGEGHENGGVELTDGVAHGASATGYLPDVTVIDSSKHSATADVCESKKKPANLLSVFKW